MAHYFIFPEKDTAIYAHPVDNSTNTGIDEVISIRDEESFTDANYHPSRILIQFKNTEIDSVINNIVKDKTIITASLKLYQTEHRELSIDQHIELYPLAESWTNGTGRLGNEPKITDGASWKYRDGSDNAILQGTFGTEWSTLTLPAGVTGSWSGSNRGGGIWYTGSSFEVTRSYGYNEEIDLSLDITSPVLKHYSASNDSAIYPSGISNNGFIIKRSGSQEFTAINDGELNFFSMDTHTIYPPHLDISWDDSDYDTTHAVCFYNISVRFTSKLRQVFQDPIVYGI